MSGLPIIVHTYEFRFASSCHGFTSTQTRTHPVSYKQYPDAVQLYYCSDITINYITQCYTELLIINLVNLRDSRFTYWAKESKSLSTVTQSHDTTAPSSCLCCSNCLTWIAEPTSQHT